MPRFNKSVSAEGVVAGGPLSRRLRPWEACVSRVSAGSVLRVKRVRLAVRLRFCLGAVERKLAPRFEGPGIRGGLRREPAGNRGLGATGWGHAGNGREWRRGSASGSDSCVLVGRKARCLAIGGLLGSVDPSGRPPGITPCPGEGARMRFRAPGVDGQHLGR